MFDVKGTYFQSDFRFHKSVQHHRDLLLTSTCRSQEECKMLKIILLTSIDACNMTLESIM